jgi:hypothetical protein
MLTKIVTQVANSYVLVNYCIFASSLCLKLASQALLNDANHSKVDGNKDYLQRYHTLLMFMRYGASLSEPTLAVAHTAFYLGRKFCYIRKKS